MRIRKAVIVAAGESSRLRPLTDELPKCLLEVGGRKIVDRSVERLRRAGVEQIAVVVGFEQDKIRRHLGGDGFTYIVNPFFRATNNLASLWFAREWLAGDAFLYQHSDIVYEPRILEAMLERREPGAIALAVDLGPTDAEAMKVRLDNGRFVESSKQVPIAEAAGEWIGLAAFPGGPAAHASLFTAAEAVFDGTSCKSYDTAAFNRMAAQGTAFQVVSVDGARWIEIDDRRDLERARRLFGE